MKNSVLYILLLAPVAFFAQNETHVTIETEGHMALVKNITFSPDGKLLYSVSDDKTIRVWDVENKILLKTYRGYIGQGFIGQIACCAISPDGKTLAVGGILGKAHMDYGAIRLINTETGEIRDMITGHESSVVTLTFTPDGKWLVSGSNDGKVGLWDPKTLEGFALTGHTSGVYGLAVSPDNSTLISAELYGTMIRWDLHKLLYEQKLSYKSIEQHTDRVRIAFSPTGEYFVTVSEDNYINLWSSKGKLIKQIDELLDPEFGKQSNYFNAICVAFSDDGSKIVVGSQKDDSQQSVHIYAIPSGEKLGVMTAHNNTVLSVDIFGNDLVATSGGNEREIILWNLNTLKIHATFKGKGKPVWKVAAGPGYSIALGTEPKEYIQINNSGDSLNKKFSLQTMEFLGEDENFDGFVSEITKTDKLEITAPSFTLVKISNSSPIVLDPDVDGKLRCMTITPGNRIVLGTTYGLYMYTNKGVFIQQLVGHTGEVYSLACSHDGRYLYSAGVDQTVRIWDLTEQGELEKTFEEYKQEMGDDYEWVVERYGAEYAKSLYTQGYRPEINPVAGLYISTDNDWICWNRDNYYATSQNGSRYVGFHVNKGLYKQAKFLTFEQFDIKYNRPDILLAGLETNADTALIELYHRAYLKRLEKLKMKESEIEIEDLLAPITKFVTPSQSVEGTDIMLQISTIDPTKKLTRLFISINGIPIYGLKGKDISEYNIMDAELQVPTKLTPGKNRIQAWCANEAGVKSNRETILVFSKSEAVKPNLYILGIGVSTYKDKKFDLNYAQKDVRDFVAFYTANNSLYSSVIVDTLMNENATLANIEKSLGGLDSAEISDHVILYIAGHGVLNSQLDYYLATHDINFSQPESKGFAYALLESAMEGIPARTKTIFIDACHGGEVDKTSMELVENTTTEKVDFIKFRSVGSSVQSQSGLSYANSFSVMKNMFTDLREGSGATIIASAGGAEYAFEGDAWNNGVFTYTLLNGLKTKAADLDGDGLIYLSELQYYLQEKVSELTNGRQKPISRYQNLSNDYVFWQ